jgi:hypothetical protein
MLCKRCRRKFDDPGNGLCPFCGEANPPASSGVMKSSTILISEGRTDAVYRSVGEVPHRLRKRLLKYTSGMNSATILIADRRGKEELAKAIRRLPGNSQQRLMEAVFGQTPASGRLRYLKPYRRIALAFVIALVITLVMWLAWSNWRI